MGSTGTGRFSDYPGTPNGSAKGRGHGGGGGGSGQPVDQCERKLTDIAIEDVARLEYFGAYGKLPSIGEQVALRPTLVGGRLGVESASGNKVIGLLPTEFNYLLQCTKQGYRYKGVVKSVSSKPVPIVRVDLEPKK